MGVVTPNDTAVVMLIILHLLALGVACVFCIGILLRRRMQLQDEHAGRRVSTVPAHAIFPQRPACWLAIRAASPEQVRTALGLRRFAPCSWSEGMTGEHEFFISPRVNGWVIVTGVALPAPDYDVDKCFHFLISLSRKVGHVQFFHVEKFQHYHAWARMDDGCVTRAYAWAGDTVWDQGAKTMPEIDLGMTCFGYGELCPPSIAARNAEKVSQLAARWNFDPAAVDERLLNESVGVAGEMPPTQ